MSVDAATASARAISSNKALSLRTALVHHWLVTRRGGERVLEQLAALFPQADIFTLVCDHESMRRFFGPRPIRSSVLQRLPKSTRWYPYYLPLFPWATERFDLSGYKLVITSDAATLKGVRTDPDALHICYCHSPMRYVWNGHQAYGRFLGPLGRAVFPPLAAWLRNWDRRAAQGVTHFVANSHTVAERVRQHYGRESTVIYPPVDTEYFSPSAPRSSLGDYFLHVSQLVPYKRADLIVEAFNRSGLPLVIIGEGSERRRLMRLAQSNIRFLGSQPDVVVREAMQGCRALVFAGEEEFGIVMAEAQACGRPVVAIDRGGAREIVTDGATGILFGEQSADSLCGALDRFEKTSFDLQEIRAAALRFSAGRFLTEFRAFVGWALDSWQSRENFPHGAVTQTI